MCLVLSAAVVVAEAAAVAVTAAATAAVAVAVAATAAVAVAVAVALLGSVLAWHHSSQFDVAVVVLVHVLAVSGSHGLLRSRELELFHVPSLGAQTHSAQLPEIKEHSPSEITTRGTNQ